MNTNQANHSLARRLIRVEAILVAAFNRCGNCNGEAEVLVHGRYPRCQACANHFITLWNTMRNQVHDGQE